MFQNLVMEYSSADLEVTNANIPLNSWWKAIPTRTTSKNKLNYESVRFLQTIRKGSSITLHYTVEYLNMWNSWKKWLSGSVLLCKEADFTQDGTILALVQSLLGMSYECPLIKGHSTKTDNISLPLKGRLLLFNEDVSDERIRIVTTVRENSKRFSERLFSAEFYIVHPAFYYKYHN
ncbi:uncharacterized protein LOC107044853 [Diachasma alloeum]|uniref:uncharacterized protein LOC107044853 n=1 Tax=Diachasma alloeum TaxID=454923 RepID=UPI0007381D2B|nr:uncharacterized protein LOC107044853 [Diachasma alloeum]